MAVLKRLSIIAILVLTIAHVRAADSSAKLQYEVKAAFLYNFLKFVEWPDEAADGLPDKPWTICVTTRDPIEKPLEELVRGKQVNGRDVVVKRLAGSSDLGACHIAFFPRDAALSPAARSRILTVGESSKFLDAGGVVNFYTEENRVRFEIRAAAGQSSGLRISSKLLSLGAR